MNYGEVFSRAWNIIWKNKVLWIFGLLASLAAGSTNGDSSNNGIKFNERWENSQIPGVENLPNIPGWAIALIVLAVLVLIIVLIVLSTLGRAGLVRGAWLADQNETPLHFSSLFQQGAARFWRVLILGLLTWAIGLTIVLMLAVPTVLTLGIALVCLWPLWCLLIPLFFALNILLKLAIISTVNENTGVMDSLRRAWTMIRAHIPEVVVMGLVLAVIAAIVSFIAVLPLAAAAAPAAIMIASGSYWASPGIIVSAVLALLYLPVLLVIRGILEAYTDTAWTVTFRRLTGQA